MATKVAIDVEVKTGEATDDIGALREELEKVKATQKELTTQMKAGFQGAEKGAKQASKGVKTLGNSFIGTLKAIGKLGVVVAVLGKLAELFKSNQRILRGFNKSMVLIEVVFSNVATAVQDLVDGLSNLKKLDFSSIAKQFSNFSNALFNGADGALEQASAIVEMREELELAEAEQRRFALSQQRLAEDERQVRDNIELTIDARKEANDKLAVILEAQIRGELKAADLRIKLREAELAMNKESIASQTALIEAQAEREDVLERINGVLSEQKTNAAALRAEEDELMAQRSEARSAMFAYLRELEDPGAADFSAKIREATDEYFEHLISTRKRLAETNSEMTAEARENHEDMLRLEAAFQIKLSNIAREQALIRRDDQIEAATQTAGALGAIAGFLEQQGEDGIQAAKGFALAELAINTAIAISSAIAGATGAASTPPTPATPFLQVAYIASMVGSVVAAMAQAQTILGSVPGGGTANTGGSFTVPTQQATPMIDPVTTNTTELGNAQSAQLAPIQAFVVETELTGSQNNITQIENQVTFGIDG
jgi:hypothetical protein